MSLRQIACLMAVVLGFAAATPAFAEDKALSREMIVGDPAAPVGGDPPPAASGGRHVPGGQGRRGFSDKGAAFQTLWTAFGFFYWPRRVLVLGT